MKKYKITILLIVTILITLCLSKYATRDNRNNRDEFRIYLLGASTVIGEPYFLDNSTIGSLIKYFFNGEIKGQKIEIKLVSGNAREIAKTAAKIRDEADLVLIYSGHNEFLRDQSDPFCDSEGKLFDYSTFASKKKSVLQEYKNAIEKIIIHFKNYRIPVVISSVAANIRGCPPVRSILINPDNKYVVDKLLESADKSFNSDNINDALVIYKKIIAVEPEFALAYMKVADCFRLLGDFRNAKVFYQKANDYDGLPHRVMDIQNQYLEELAKKHNVYFMDAVKILENMSEDGLIGYNLMWDNCHPRFEGYIAIALGFVKQIENIFGVKGYRTEATTEEIKNFFHAGPEVELGILESRGSYFCRLALLTKDCDSRNQHLDGARVCFKTALQINPDNPQLLGSVAIYHALRKDKSESIIFWLKAFRKDPKGVKERIQNRKVKRIMKDIGIKNLLLLLKEDVEKD